MATAFDVAGLARSADIRQLIDEIAKTRSMGAATFVVPCSFMVVSLPRIDPASIVAAAVNEQQGGPMAIVRPHYA